MKEDTDIEVLKKRQRDQMLRLVARGFYRELTHYGVESTEVLSVASHLLDNLMQKTETNGTSPRYYDQLLSRDRIRVPSRDKRRLAVDEVEISNLNRETVGRVADWLKANTVRESFIPRLPRTAEELADHFKRPDTDYFQISFRGDVVGVIGGENVDRESGKLEMRKLVGDDRHRGKGIGKRATFLFLHHAFDRLEMNKVYLHTSNINIRNINLNSRFGFQVEGIFFEDFREEGRVQDVMRMALVRRDWNRIFAKPSPPAANP